MQDSDDSKKHENRPIKSWHIMAISIVLILQVAGLEEKHRV